MVSAHAFELLTEFNIIPQQSLDLFLISTRFNLLPKAPVQLHYTLLVIILFIQLSI